MTGTLFFGMTTGQLVTLALIGVVLLIILFILSRVIKLTGALVKLGCLTVIILGAIILTVWMIGK